jgi:FixJ family two-component response regulator
MDGLELQEQLAREESLLPVVFIGGCDNISLAVQAVKRGAFEFLAVPLDDQHVLECVGNAIREDARRRRRQATRMEAAARLGRLTAREREVFELVVLGRTNKEIGSRLHISTKTVVAHRAKVMLKTEADNLVELLRLADLGLDASWITHRQF